MLSPSCFRICLVSFALAQHTAVKSLALCAQLPFCGSGRLYLQSLVFAMLDKPHSLSPFQSNCSSLTVWVACNQLNCSETGLEPQTECSALECPCCALRSGIPGSAGCAPAAPPRVPRLLLSLLCLPAAGPFWHTCSLWSSQGLFLPRCKASLL